ncbi:hypothetical protein ACU6PC_005171 [Escherichia coli]
MALASLEAEPVNQTYNLPELIEGMEVSIDVSTCDADLGNRYFGTVTEALELDTAKNGYILLVQDAEPNFDVNGNSPVTRIKRYRKYPRQHLEDLSTGKKEALPVDDDGCTGSNAVFGVITHVINDARSGEFDDCPVI